MCLLPVDILSIELDIFFLFLALFRPPGTRLIGFTDDGAHANGTVDEGGDHLISSHHVREEHHVLFEANAAGCQGPDHAP